MLIILFRFNGNAYECVCADYFLLLYGLCTRQTHTSTLVDSNKYYISIKDCARRHTPFYQLFLNKWNFTFEAINRRKIQFKTNTIRISNKSTQFYHILIDVVFHAHKSPILVLNMFRAMQTRQIFHKHTHSQLVCVPFKFCSLILIFI